MPTYVVAATATSVPIQVGPGAVISIVPTNSVAEYSKDHRSLVLGGQATWVSLAYGSEGVFTGAGFWFRVTAPAGAAATVTVDDSPSAATQRRFQTDYYTLRTSSSPLSTETLRQVATGSKVSWVRDATNKARMSRTMHFARDRITSLRLAFSNWYVASFDTPTDGTELAQGVNSTTIEVSIEYPVGTFTRVKFSGSDQGTILAGETLISDATYVSIPNGAQFYVRNHQANASGIPRPAGIPLGNLNNSATTTTNLCMSGDVTGNDGYGVTPLAILGYSSKPVVAIIGDSIWNGEAGTIIPRLYTGIERMIGPSYAFINLATSGDRASYAVSNFAKRGAMLQYCTHVCGNHGVNDFTNSRTSAQVLADLTTLYGLSYFTGKPVFHSTITPKTATTSESDYTTDVGQNTHSTNAERVAFNVALRNGDASAFLSGLIDTEKFVQSPTKTGVWTPYDGTALTTDGTHPNRHAFVYMQGQMTFPALI